MLTFYVNSLNQERTIAGIRLSHSHIFTDKADNLLTISEKVFQQEHKLFLHQMKYAIKFM